VPPNRRVHLALGLNMVDYMEEALVKPIVGRLWSLMKPGAMLLAFFHTKQAGPDAPCYRYHVVGTDSLEIQPIHPRRESRRGPAGAVQTVANTHFRLQRVFNNR